MIVFKYTYDTSVGEFTPTFNSEYVYTTTTSTSGTLKTVTIESDTAFTSLSWGSSSISSVTKIDLVDVSGLKSLAGVFRSFTSLTSITVINATTTLLDISLAFYQASVLTDLIFANCDFTAINNVGNCFTFGPSSVATNVNFTNVKFNNTSKDIIRALSVATNMKIENCDFGSVTDMSSAFASCIGLTGTMDLSTTPFSPNVTSIQNMFNGCTNLTKIIMPKGDFPLLTNMNQVFYGCANLKEIDFSGFSTKGASISFQQTFGECNVLEEIDLSSLGATSTSFYQMVYNCLKIKKVNLSGIKMATGVTCSLMFYAVSTMEWIDISNFYVAPTDVSNFNNTNKDTIKNIGALYCPANIINYYANLMVNTGNVCNIYYHDAKLEDLTVDSRFNYIYCEEYHGDVVTTPDDLELYSFTDIWDNITIADNLDLTTGIVTKNVGILDITDINTLIYSGYDSTNDLYNVSCSFANFPNIVAKGNNTLASSNILERKWYTIEGLYSHGIGGKFEFRISGTRGITSGDEAKQWVIDNLIMFYERTPETIQLDINPLKSYRNGSIQTSSQQLAPTLKTTLPISNKFATTNLTSGATYNVYFDGTATKLDAGGTIITNPISPCEVECGGTTLTIEGTDIQNVRVIETSVKNEVGSVCGTTDVELKKMKTCKYENILDDINYNTTVWNGAVININYDDFCIEFMGNHGWAAEFADTGLKYPTGCSLVHVEFDIDMDNPNLRMAINFNEGIYNSYPQHRHVTLNNDTATIAQGNYDGIYTSIITKGHFSRLMYANGDRPIIINLYTGSYITGNLATENSAEGSIDGYETIGSNYGRITNLKMRIIENFSSNYTTVTSVLRDSSYNIIWQDMDMTMPVTTSKLEQPIKLRSLGTTYDSYNPVTGELIKRIGVSETDGSYSVLSSPIIISSNYKILQDNNIILDSFPQEMNSAYVDFLPTQLLPNTTYTVFLDATTAVGQLECGLIYNGDWYDGMKNFTVGVQSFVYTTDNQIDRFGGFRIRGWGSIINNLIMVQGEYSLDYYNPIIPPQLYTDGQVKVYSDSDVYPTTILNGQSTNNYEINELNTSNNYTIRYEGECESINLANKSNEQGTNRIVKSGATSGNLTFVNDSGNIDNVLLIQNDVREQEINHFNGLQTVEINQLFASNKQNLFEAYMKNDFEYTTNLNSGTKQYGSLHNGVFKCGELAGGLNRQMAWNLIHPIAQPENSSTSKTRENEPIMKSGNYYHISFNIEIQDYNDGNHSYAIRFYNQNLQEVPTYKLNGNQQDISFTTNGTTNPIIKQRFSATVRPTNGHDIYCILFHANYGGAWKFDCTITDFTICEPEYAKPDVPLVYEYIDLPQPVQLNSLPDGTCDTYNPITGEYVQNVGYVVYDDTTTPWNSYAKDFYYTPCPSDFDSFSIFITYHEKLEGTVASKLWAGNSGQAIAASAMIRVIGLQSKDEFLEYIKQYPLQMTYTRKEPITTQLTPINIPTFEGGILQLITTDGKVFPMVEYSMPTNNRYDTSSWETGTIYTQRNMTEAYFNESTTPMTPTETMTLTTDHISSGSIILNDNGNGLIVLKGNYTGRDIPYFTGMRSVEAIEVETTPSPDQPLFGKGGRK